MPRHEANNPTERIARLLDETETLLFYNQLYRDQLIKNGISFEPCPAAIEYEKERVRQGLTGKQTRTKRDRARLRATMGATTLKEARAKEAAEIPFTSDLTIEDIEKKLQSLDTTDLIGPNASDIAKGIK